MKNIIIKSVISIVILIFSFMGCWDSHNHHSINDPETEEGSGYITGENRNVSECSGVNLKYYGKVYLKQGSEQSIHVEADDNIIDDVVTRNENGYLTTGLRNGSYSNVTVKVYVTLKSIENISIEGSGAVYIENSINCDKLTCSINGAGDIDLWGSANNLDCRINGAGNISAFDFITKYCTAKISGTGNCSLNVTEDLDASISGVGNIIYSGEPKRVTSSISGMGKIGKK